MKKLVLLILVGVFCTSMGLAFAAYEINAVTGKVDKTRSSAVTVVDFDPADYGGVNWGDSGALIPFNWGWNSGVTKPNITFGDGTMDFYNTEVTIHGTNSQIKGANQLFFNFDTARKVIVGSTGGTYNENLRIDNDTTSNTIALDSTTGANILDLGSFNLRTLATANWMGNVSIGTFNTPTNTISAAGNVSIGTAYAIAQTAPSNGVIIQGNVGVGTFAPSSKMQVVGTVTATAFVGDGSGITGISGSGTVNSGVTGAVGKYVGSTTIDDSAVLFEDGGNIGIGTPSPVAALQVVGTVNATAFVGDGSGLTGVSGGAAGWVDGGTNVYVSPTTDNVGIGTTTPTAALLVENAGTQDSFRVNDSVIDVSPFVISSAGNVGIGTINPTSHFQYGSVAASNFITMNTANAPAMAIRADAATSADLLNIQGLALVSNNALDVSSSSASQTVPLVSMTQSGASSGGTLLANQSSATSTGRAVRFINAGTSDSFYVEDVSSDPTPFVISSAGNVGIGTTTPSSVFDVRGDEARIWTGAGTVNNATASGELYVEGDLEVDGTIYGDGAGITGLAAGGWTDGGAAVYTTASTDLVGIGTFAPVSQLQVVGTITATSFQSTSTSAGSLVLSEASANGSNTITVVSPSSVASDRTCTLQDDSTPFDDCVSATASGWTDGGASIYLTTSTDNVGIGTFAPIRPLEIKATASSGYPSFGVSNTAGEDIRFLVNSTDDNPGASFGSADAIPIYFFTNDLDVAPGPAIALPASGDRVGIGTIAPRSILEVDKGTGTAQITIDGTTGGCFMIQDTDGAGWTECDVLNGVMSCSTDADGVCD